jgi:hypothetical protein
MAHFAQIDDDSIVVQVLVVDDSMVERGQEFLAEDLGLGGTWIQTSYNTFGGIHLNGETPLRKNFANIGYIYDPVRDAFYQKQPFNSWTLNDDTCIWEAPLEKPNDNKSYEWSESNMNWVEIPNE